jgi:hypothetical protein
MDYEVRYRLGALWQRLEALERLLGTWAVFGHGLLVAAGVVLLFGKTWPLRVAGVCRALAGVAQLACVNAALALVALAAVGPVPSPYCCPPSANVALPATRLRWVTSWPVANRRCSRHMVRGARAMPVPTDRGQSRRCVRLTSRRSRRGRRNGFPRHEVFAAGPAAEPQR